METFQAAGIFPFRVLAAVCTVVGGLALLLAWFGVYGLLSYSVSQRTWQLLASRLFFMKSFEPVALLIGVMVPLAAAAVAAYVPARRAASVEPTTALRHD